MLAAVFDRVRFTENASEALHEAQVVFIAVGTPPLPDGNPDLRYLREAGFLAVLPMAPWPFLYDDSRKGAAYAITDKLALGITGWDPTNFLSHPKFYVNTNALRGLQRVVPFPGAGDLRWTGATPKRVPPSELYGSLVQLRDEQGHSVGDAVVYIQHRTPSLSPGKTLYVWMRMPELLGKNEFYPSLLQFISTKLKPL